MRFKHCPHCQALNQIPQSLLDLQSRDQEKDMRCDAPGGCGQPFKAKKNRSEVHGVEFFDGERVSSPKFGMNPGVGIAVAT